MNDRGWYRHVKEQQSTRIRKQARHYWSGSSGNDTNVSQKTRYLLLRDQRGFK